MSSSTNSLRPAWHRGNQSGKGFQPPPTVASERSRSQSVGNAGESNSRRDSNFNAFAALDDDEDVVPEASTEPEPAQPEKSKAKGGNSRSEAFRSASRSASTGSKQGGGGGRSLADLAARVPVERTSNRFSSLRKDSAGSEGDAKIIRYTREKLLSMRPEPAKAPPECVKALEGSVIYSEVAQDPVSWDFLEADEIWATAPRRTSTLKTGIPDVDSRRASSRASASSGRWQRGVALPPPDQAGKKGRDKEATSPNELWDDPGATGAASDFSAFGAMPADDEPFDFDKMAEASRKFEEERRGGTRSRSTSEADQDDLADGHVTKVDPKRPLASAGTTIRSGSGDDVNVFEDFDEPGLVEETQIEAEESRPAIKGADEDPTASSRLMAMIGVKREDTGLGGVSEKPSTASPWGGAGTQQADGPAIPLNPWGTPLMPPQNEVTGLNIQAQLAQAELEKKRKEEELRRRQEHEQAQRRAAQQQEEERARQVALQQQHRQQQEGVQSQVEIVLLERISSILENSWGRSDLVSILSTLHAEDSRVIPLLSNADALRALILRHPRRITVRQDPGMGAEMAILVMTNAQWQQQLQQQQGQAQAMAHQEEQRRLEERRRLVEEQQKAAAQAMPPISPTAPWYYSDPQNNIQGPFKGSEMRQWLKAGYFKGDLPISQQPSGPFRPLSVIFPNLASAFAGEDPAEAAAAERTKLEAQEKERAEAERARSEAEAKIRAEKESRETAARAEQQRLTDEAERARQEKEKSNAARKNSNGGNESSAQLKMMLGLSSQEGGSAAVAPAPMEKSEAPAAPNAQQKKSQKAAAKKGKQAPVVEQPARPTAEPAPAPAWGGATQPASRKSMSEIQKEEARASAMLAMQHEKSRSSSSGWANVAAARGGSTAWAGGAVKPTNAAVIAATPTTSAGGPSAGARSRSQANAQGGANRSSAGSAEQGGGAQGNEFGATMSPELKKWCMDQMVKLQGTDDLTLVSFCMTLKDPTEIRQYLAAYLGSSPAVNSFATDFINKRGLGGGNQQEQWESTVTGKKSRKKKAGGR